MRPDQLSFNQATAKAAPTEAVLDACASQEIRHVALWRDNYVGGDVTRTARAVHERDLSVSSLCRAGFFTNSGPQTVADEDNRRAVDEAAALGASSLVLVCGPVRAEGFRAAERQITDSIARLAPHAEQAGVRLAIEPFHPMLAAERSAVVTLDQASDIVEAVNHPAVGIAIDSYHVWWDPRLESAMKRARPYVVVAQLADWLVPTTSLLTGRGLPGDGIADLAGFLRLLDHGGFTGPVEIEVLNADVWETPLDALLLDIKQRIALLGRGLAPCQP